MDDMSQPPVPFDDAGRAEVLAELDGRIASASLRPSSLITPSPLRPLPAGAAARLNSRAAAGLDPSGADHPRREIWQWTVVPSVIGAAAFVTLLVGLLISHDLLALVAGLILAGSIVTGVALSTWVLADPLRLRHDERRALTNARFWESRQAWIGRIHDAPERALVGLAADLVSQIAASPAWNTTYLDAHRARFDLIVELDHIDAQAHQCATVRVARPADPAAEANYLGLVDRVVALRRYAKALDGLGDQLAAAAASVDAELRGTGFAAHPTAMDYQTGELRQLTSELTSLNSSIAESIAKSRPGLTGRD
jgi:hypothetical protein